MGVLSCEQESELVKRAKTDVKAFQTLYEYYLPKLYRYAYYRTQSSHEAEDIVSQVFLKALEQLKKDALSGTSFGNWLYRVATNIIIDKWRKNSKPYKECYILDEPNITADNSDLSEKISNKVTLRNMLSLLPDAQQQVLILRYIEDLSISQVAEIMGRSEGAIKQLAFRGLKNMRERMNAYDR